ncbi:hypothetical protein G6F59_015766 [Rhizopus arrhizus]|nr:hypothetical protein G6F59_015766 [Rhizopus arrhizus]
MIRQADQRGRAARPGADRCQGGTAGRAGSAGGALQPAPARCQRAVEDAARGGRRLRARARRPPRGSRQRSGEEDPEEPAGPEPGVCPALRAPAELRRLRAARRRPAAAGTAEVRAAQPQRAPVLRA